MSHQIKVYQINQMVRDGKERRRRFKSNVTKVSTPNIAAPPQARANTFL